MITNDKLSTVREDLLRENRFATITAAPFPLDGVSLRSMKGEERLGTPFRYRAKFLSSDPIRDFGKMPGQKMTVGLRMADRLSTRYFNGVITALDYVGIEDTRRLNYEVELRPWLAFLELRRNSRTFHDKTSIEIIRTIFGEHGGRFRAKLSTTPPRRPVCIQYDETDFAFVSRLMEHDGIYYFFEHEEKDHVLILADDPADHDRCKPEIVHTRLNLKKYRFSDDIIWRWRERTVLTPARITLQNYDHEKPKAVLNVSEPVPSATMGKVRGTAPTFTERRTAAEPMRASATATAPGNDKRRESFHFPARFTQQRDGTFHARRAAEAVASRAYRAEIEGTMRQVTVGCRFKAENPYDAPDGVKMDDPKESWLAVAGSFEITGEAGDLSRRASESADPEDPHFLYRAVIEAQSATTPFRPAMVTPWPKIAGPQTAVVIGARGAAIATDKLGRVRVRFHWDRDGASSGWIRVAQPWAGNGFGALVTPRVGQEVVVHFHDGNPDWPIITGAVYNASNQPAETLPDKASRSSFRTQTVPGRSLKYNELRFDDQDGAEEVLLRAERDFNLKVGRTHRTEVGHRYVLSAGPEVGPTGSFIEVSPSGIRLVVRGPTGPQGIEIGALGVSIIGQAVGLYSRTVPISLMPAFAPVPNPALTGSLASINHPAKDAKIKE